MFVEKTYLSSSVEPDKDGLALIAAACNALTKGPVTVEDLWPGTQRSLSS